MGTTPEYTKNAINRYNAKFDRVAVNLPKGTKERIKDITGLSCNAYISTLVLADLERLEAEETAEIFEYKRKSNAFPGNKECQKVDMETRTPELELLQKQDEEGRRRVLDQLEDMEFARQQRDEKQNENCPF